MYHSTYGMLPSGGSTRSICTAGRYSGTLRQFTLYLIYPVTLSAMLLVCWLVLHRLHKPIILESIRTFDVNLAFITTVRSLVATETLMRIHFEKGKGDQMIET